MNTMQARTWGLWALGWRSDTLQKLKIYYEDDADGWIDGGPIEVLFNPAELKFNHDLHWKTTPIPGSVAGGYYRLEFQNAAPTTLTMDLFFDTYEGDPNASTSLLKSVASTVLPTDLFATVSGTQVTDYTSEIERLAQIHPELHRPPRCELHWGNTLLLTGVLTRMGQDFIHFLPDGTPVRASVSCTFQEYTPFRDAAELHSPDVHRTRVVRRGDTLSGIAQEVYSDASKWRTIAQANGIVDPRGIRPGQVLIIPALTR